MKRNIAGIVYSEYIMLKPSLGRYVALLLFYWILSYFGLYSVEIALALGQILLTLCPIALFSLEEEENSWAYFYLVPQGREILVKARYLFALGLSLLVTLVHLLVLVLWQVLLGGKVPLFVLYLSSMLGIFLLSAFFPLYYNLGGRRSRPWFFLLLLVPLGLLVIFHQYITDGIRTFQEKTGELSLLSLCVALFLLEILLAFFSFRKSLEGIQKQSWQQRGRSLDWAESGEC